MRNPMDFIPVDPPGPDLAWTGGLLWLTAGWVTLDSVMRYGPEAFAEDALAAVEEDYSDAGRELRRSLSLLPPQAIIAILAAEYLAMLLLWPRTVARLRHVECDCLEESCTAHAEGRAPTTSE